jgi:hypothetical protein
MKPTKEKFFAALKTIKRTDLSKSKRLQLGLIDDADDLLNDQQTIINSLTTMKQVVEEADAIVQETYQEKLALEEEIRELDEKQELQMRDWTMESNLHEIDLEELQEVRVQIDLIIENLTAVQQELGIDIPMDRYYQALDENDTARQDNIILDLPF